MPSYSSAPIGLLTSASTTSIASLSSSSPPLTLAVLGCGAMGVAILSGMLASIAEMDAPRPLQQDRDHRDPRDDIVPERLPGRFIACVRRTEAAKKVKAALWAHSSSVQVVQNDNVHAVQLADVVLLACQPHAVPALLAEPGMVRALHGKLLISICAGVSVEQIEAHLHGGTVPTLDPDVDGRCRVVRAMPNAAALLRQSMTVIAADAPLSSSSSSSAPSSSSSPPPTSSSMPSSATPASPSTLPPAATALVTWIFSRIGAVAYQPSAARMDACTALCAAGPAFFALVLEAAVDGAVAKGLPRADALRMAAQSMRGTASLVLDGGDHPAQLRDRIATPAGCTIAGLTVLEEGNLRATVSRAVRETIAVASQLGKGV